MPVPNQIGLPTVLLSRIGGIEIDAVLNETHRYQNQVTQHPLEDGRVLNDHIVNLPVVLEMEGRLTDTPFPGPDAERGTLPAGVDLMHTMTVGTARQKFQRLVSLQEARITFDVVTGLHVYRNMTFESLSFPRSARDGRSIRFTAGLRELLIAGRDTPSNRERISEALWHTALSPRTLGLTPKIPSTLELKPITV